MGCIESRERAPIPWELSSLSRHEWLEWKKCFLNFMYHKYIPPYKQINSFYKYIGILGEEIANRLYFRNSKNEIVLKDLLFKFDVYFIYGGIERRNQSIPEYIAQLKNIAKEAGNNNNIENIVKEKILTDFHQNNIFHGLKNLNFLTSTVIDFEELSLHELIFLWNESEKTEKKHQYLIDTEKRRNTLEYLDARELCIYCGLSHSPNRCYARGKMCWKCEESNHFARCCLRAYITDCHFCGSSHAQNKCPAFAKECSKCKRMNHFSWRCFVEVIESCIHCGRRHIANRQYCIAKNSRCSICQRMGHFSSSCLSLRR